MAIDNCETVKVAADNKEGYYICDADKVPDGAKLFVAQPQKKTRNRKAK